MVGALGIVILAAGSSRRFGPENKLASTYKDKPLLQYSLACAQELHAQERVLVTGHEAETVRQIATGFTGTFIHNPDHASGMGASIACGVGALSPDIQTIIILLGDMPDITPAFCNTLIEAYNGKITRPVCQGKPGHPVIFPARFRFELEQLSGDKGAVSFMKNHTQDIQLIATHDPACLRDIDYSSSKTI